MIDDLANMSANLFVGTIDDQLESVNIIGESEEQLIAVFWHEIQKMLYFVTIVYDEVVIVSACQYFIDQFL